ncbi:CinA family protein [Parvibium lacunae]|uniref:CinA family protein n=1 Tax=Parvibium lacunae TaxID=1888893 RepID=A0A368L4M4_9BURK|nr:CinA family protein [Parvibium lacunae]RCS58536.1 CinA family protein [Parvibium lacunae]
MTALVIPPYASSDSTSVSAALGHTLQSLGEEITVAESCTGGLLAAALTEVPGASQWFACGWVAYANWAKQQELGVTATLISENGVVSGAVVEAMARGACQQARAQLGLAISGIAGPDGGTPGKPVGTVWMAAYYLPRSAPDATPRDFLQVEQHHFPGNRTQIRHAAVLAALNLGLTLLNRAHQ